MKFYAIANHFFTTILKYAWIENTLHYIEYVQMAKLADYSRNLTIRSSTNSLYWNKGDMIAINNHFIEQILGINLFEYDSISTQHGYFLLSSISNRPATKITNNIAYQYAEILNIPITLYCLLADTTRHCPGCLMYVMVNLFIKCGAIKWIIRTLLSRSYCIFLTKYALTGHPDTNNAYRYSIGFVPDEGIVFDPNGQFICNSILNGLQSED